MKQFIWMLCGIFVSGLLLGTLSACGADQFSTCVITTEKASPAQEAAPAPAAASAMVPIPAAPAAAPAAEEAPAVTAPLVGTFYAAPAPEQPPFAMPGDKVKKGQTVCLIEAMKTMIEVPAPCDCVIEEVLKANGELAAFGEALMRYRPC